MSVTNINYSNFQPDWWDAAGVTTEAVKAEIASAIKSTFGTGLTAIQQQSMIDSASKYYDWQQATKAAANAAQQAANNRGQTTFSATI